SRPRTMKPNGGLPALRSARGIRRSGRMAHHRRRAHGWTIPALIGLAILAVAAAVRESRADRIQLRGGGQIKGKVLPDPQHPDRVLILTGTGKTPLSFQKAKIVQVHAAPSALDEYLERRAKL